MADVPNLLPAMGEILLAAAAMALMMVGVFRRADGPLAESATAGVVSRLSMLALVVVIAVVLVGAGGRQTTFAGLFVADPFASFFKVLVLLAALASLLVARGFLDLHGIHRFEFPVLMLFASVGMMMMVSANDLVSLYLGLEMQSLSLYVLAAFQRDDVRATEAGLKYFVLGALASGMLLYGASLVYGYAGSTGFEALAQQFQGLGGEAPPVGVVVGLVFVIAGLAFKVSAVPFHMWTPDVYEGAPTPVTAFFSVGPKLAAMALFIRVLVGPFGDLVDEWRQIIVFISIASMALGAFAAINQSNIKRLMAYSSIGHVGYALIGLAVGDSLGVQAVLVYMAIYLFMNMGAFACILCMRRGHVMVEGIDDLAGLSRSHPALAFALAVFMFSMAGIPPLAGFFAKVYIFLAAIEAELYALAVIGVLTSVVGAYYYIRIVKVMYFDELAETLDRPVARPIGAVLLVATVVIVLFFAYPAPILVGAEAAAAALFPG